MANLERITAKTKLGTGYFKADELARMTGQPKHMFAAVVLKELLDNALDACEDAKVAPEISVAVGRHNVNLIVIKVSDNAGGIPPEVVTGMLDFDIRISDKSVYRSPTRGQMGNAWKTIIGVPYALGARGGTTTVITSRGVEHRISAELDPTGDVIVKHEQKAVAEEAGTTVTVILPDRNFTQSFEPELWVRSAAMYNPHVSFRLYNQKVVGRTTWTKCINRRPPSPRNSRR